MRVLLNVLSMKLKWIFSIRKFLKVVTIYTSNMTATARTQLGTREKLKCHGHN